MRSWRNLKDFARAATPVTRHLWGGLPDAPNSCNVSRSHCRRSQCERSHLQPHATRRPSRLASSGQLMAQGSGLVLPRLGTVPVVHRLVADDRLAVMLAKALLELDIAVPGDWKRADHDPTSFIRITLERWIDTHGGSAIRHRFLLSAVISNSPSDWAERDETKPNQLFLIVEPSEATCGCATFGPTLKLTGERPPATAGDILPPLCRSTESVDQGL